MDIFLSILLLNFLERKKERRYMETQQFLEHFTKRRMANGHTLKFVFDHFLTEIGITYNAVAQQIKGYTGLSEPVKQGIQKYLQKHG